MAIKPIQGGEIKRIYSQEFYLTEADVLGVSDVIQPVAIMNSMQDYTNVVKYANNSLGSPTIIYTTPTDKDFFLCGLNISSDGSIAGTASISVKLPNESNDVILVTVSQVASIIGGDTLMDSENISHDFSRPIKLARGSQITLTDTGITAYASIYGYTKESLNK